MTALGWLTIGIVGTVVGLSVEPAEGRTVDVGEAVASWSGDGRLVQLEDGGVVFNGVIQGMLFIRQKTAPRDPLHAARVACPAVVHIDRSKDERRSNGVCIFTSPGGEDIAYASWECAGKEECRGEFTFTGGQGAFSGMSGQTSFVSHLDIPGMESGQLFGYARWPNLTYSVP